MNQTGKASTEHVAELLNAKATGDIVLVCEHASRNIPDEFRDLGLSGDVLTSHAAWDIGAMAVARHMSETLDAPLVASRISRLVYDCNRPPEASDAMPARSEIFSIPGNTQLTDKERQHRSLTYYEPFRAQLQQTLHAIEAPKVVTVHSFTRQYMGITRDVEIGILHDEDSRFADAMLQTAPLHTKLKVRRNEPYGPGDGVTHTLKVHAIPQGRPNIMIEIQNDLIRTAETQAKMAALLSTWVQDAISKIGGRS